MAQILIGIGSRMVTSSAEHSEINLSHYVRIGYTQATLLNYPTGPYAGQLCLEMLIFEFPGIAHMYQVIGGLARRCSEQLSSSGFGRWK